MDGLISLPRMLIIVSRMGPLCGVISLGALGVGAWKWRVAAAGLLTLVVLPASGIDVPDHCSLSVLAPIMAREVGIGTALGLALSTLGISIQLSGQLLGALSGGTWGTAYGGGPGDETPLVRFLVLTVLVTFFSTAGHRVVLAAILDTYRWMPPAAGWDAGSAVEMIATLLGHALLFGLRAAAPMILALMVGSVVVGLATRLAPAFGQLSLNLGLNVLLLVASLTLGLGTMTRVYQRELGVIADQWISYGRRNIPVEPSRRPTHVAGSEPGVKG